MNGLIPGQAYLEPTAKGLEDRRLAVDGLLEHSDPDLLVLLGVADGGQDPRFEER